MAGVSLADTLGHKDLATTQIYAMVQQEHLRTVIGKLNGCCPAQIPTMRHSKCVTHADHPAIDDRRLLTDGNLEKGWKGRLRGHQSCRMRSTEFPPELLCILRTANYVRVRRDSGRQICAVPITGCFPGMPFARRNAPRGQLPRLTRVLLATRTCCRRNRRSTSR
jgi:hypothetical protein